MLFTITLIFSAAPLYAAEEYSRDWSDLDEEHERMYGSERTKKFRDDAFFYQYELWEGHTSRMIFWVYKSTDYPRYEAIRFWPFYGNLKSKIDERERTWALSGFYYHKTDRDYDYHHIFPLYASTRYRTSIDRNILYLIQWGGKEGPRDTSYFNIFPLIFSNSYESKDGKDRGGDRTIFPVWYSDWSETTSTYESKNRFQINPLWGYNSRYFRTASNQVSQDDTWFWSPVIPLVYYHGTITRWHLNLFWLFDLERQRGTTRRFFFLPFTYYSYNEALNRQETVSLTPLWLYGSTFETAKNGGAERLTGRTFGFPLIPFLYYRSYSERNGTHLNLITLLDWSWNAAGDLERFCFIPFIFYYPGQAGQQSSSVSPLWYYSSVANPKIGEETTLCVPLIPLFYSHSSTREGTHRNLFWLIDWRSRADGSFGHFWFIPLVFHNGGEGGYIHYLPFYFRLPGWTEREGISFGLFHYYRWSPDEEVLWWPLRYYRENTRTNEKVSHWFPLWYSWNNVSLFEAPKSSGTIFIPFYFSYEDERHSLTFFLPGISISSLKGPLTPDLMLMIGRRENSWYLDTDVSWLYDVVSVSTRTTIRNPFAPAQPDTGSAAKSAIAPPAAARGGAKLTSAETAKSPATETAASPTLTRRNEISRETSTEFFGWKVLFGWLAWEHADTKRHFRLLPLAWFSWDEQSDNEVSHIFPIYFSYKDAQVEYFVLYPLLLPLYGMSRDGDSYMRAFLLNAYWIEYDAQRREYEHTVLWPAFNLYTSPERFGWRIFPLFWYKTAESGGTSMTRVVSPLYYYHSRAAEGSRYERVVAPFIISTTEERPGSYSQSAAFPVIPIFFYNHDRSANRPRTEGQAESTSESTSHFLIPLYYYSQSEDRFPGQSITACKSTFIGLPFIYYSSFSIPPHNSTPGVEQSTLFFPGFYRNADGERRHVNIIGLIDYGSDPAAHTGRFLFLPFYIGLYGEHCSHTIPLLFSHFEHGERYSQTVIALFWHKNDGEAHRGYCHFLPLWLSFSEGTEARSSDSLMIPALPIYYRGVDRERTGLMRGTGTTSFFLPFAIWQTREKSLADGSMPTTDFTLLGLPLLYYSSTETAEGDTIRSSSTFFLLGFYRHTDDLESHTNLLGFLNLRYDAKRDESFNYLFPFFAYEGNERKGYFSIPGILLYYGWDGDIRQILIGGLFWHRYDPARQERYLHLFPILISRRAEDSSTFIFLGTYWHFSRDYSRQNLWYLFDHRHRRLNGYDEWNMLFGLVNYESSEMEHRFRLALGILAEYTSRANSPDWSAHMLWLGYECRGEYRQWNFLPLAYYSEDAASGTWCFPLALQYYARTGESVFHVVGGGVIYYRNFEPAERRDRAMVLLGTLWNYVEKPTQDNARDYESHGMLWGLLWEYETERANGAETWSQFSMLFRLYRHINDNGEVTHRFLGISI